MTYKKILFRRDCKPPDNIPGDRIRYFRNQLNLNQRDFSKLCKPTMNFTAIGRIERNQGYTKSSLEKIAKVCNCHVSDFFIPEELKLFSYLSKNDQEIIISLIQRLYEAGNPEQSITQTQKYSEFEQEKSD